MKKLLFLILMLAQAALAQLSATRYETEMLKNPHSGGKDTREVNAVRVFEKDALLIASRRKKGNFREFKYSEIKYVEHSFSKTPIPSVVTRSRSLSLFFTDPLFYPQKPKHWLTIPTANDFAVLKIENDNFRLLRMEFLVRDFDLNEINEDRQ